MEHLASVDPSQYVNRFVAKGLKTMNFRTSSPRISNDDGVNALKRNLEQRSIRLKLKQQMKVEQALRELQIESDINYMPSDLEPAIEPITAIPLIPEYKCIDIEYPSVSESLSAPKVSNPSRIKVNNDRLEERVAGVQKLLQDQDLLALKNTSMAPKKTKDICKQFCDEQLIKAKNQRLQQGKEYLVNKKKKQAELKAQQEHEIKLKKLQQKKRITELYRISDAKLRASLQQPKPKSIATAVKSRSTSAPSKSKVSMNAPLEFDDVIIKPPSPVHKQNVPSEHENSATENANIWRRSENLKNIQENMASIIPARMTATAESPKKYASSPLNDSGRSSNSFTSNCSTKSHSSSTSNRSKTTDRSKNRSYRTHQMNEDIHIDESKIILQQNRNKLKINKVLDRCTRVNDMLTRISFDLRKSQKTKLELEETLAKSIAGSSISIDSKADYSSNKKEIMVLTNTKLPDSRSFIISPPRKKVTFSAKTSNYKPHRPKSKKTRNHIALSRRQYKATMVKAFLKTLAPQQLRQMKAAKKKN